MQDITINEFRAQIEADGFNFKFLGTDGSDVYLKTPDQKKRIDQHEQWSIYVPASPYAVGGKWTARHYEAHTPVGGMCDIELTFES